MLTFLTGCKARPARNFLIMSASELKSRLTYKIKSKNILLSSIREAYIVSKDTVFTTFKLGRMALLKASLQIIASIPVQCMS